jgi:hypothetical protein
VVCSLSICTYFQSRGSRNSVTGPTSDRFPDRSGGGGYTFIDSSFPRRPGDVARLSSLIFPQTGTSLGCLKYNILAFQELCFDVVNVTQKTTNRCPLKGTKIALYLLLFLVTPVLPEVVDSLYSCWPFEHSYSVRTLQDPDRYNVMAQQRAFLLHLYHWKQTPLYVWLGSGHFHQESLHTRILPGYRTAATMRCCFKQLCRKRTPSEEAEHSGPQVRAGRKLTSQFLWSGRSFFRGYDCSVPSTATNGASSRKVRWWRHGNTHNHGAADCYGSEFSRKRMQIIAFMTRTVYAQSCEINIGKLHLYRTQFPHRLFALLNACILLW